MYDWRIVNKYIHDAPCFRQIKNPPLHWSSTSIEIIFVLRWVTSSRLASPTSHNPQSVANQHRASSPLIMNRHASRSEIPYKEWCIGRAPDCLNERSCKRPGFETRWHYLDLSEKYHCFSPLNVLGDHVNGGLVELSLRPVTVSTSISRGPRAARSFNVIYSYGQSIMR